MQLKQYLTILDLVETGYYNFLDLLYCLFIIQLSDRFGAKTRQEAKILSTFPTLEAILIALIYLAIFQMIAPLSEYLQTSNLDIFKAYQMVEQATAV